MADHRRPQSPHHRIVPVTSIGGPYSGNPDQSSVVHSAGHQLGNNGLLGFNVQQASQSPPDLGVGSSKPKRKRSMIACKNCNERRVRCDATSVGLPCTNCKNTGKSDCQFIESRRVRGARGRFESRDGGRSGEDGRSVSMDGPRQRPARRHSITGSLPADSEEWRQLLQNSAAVNRAAPGPVTYLGESWHFSWVLDSYAPAPGGRDSGGRSRPLHLPTLVMEDEKDTPGRINEELWAKGAYILPPADIRDRLLEQYFEIVHPVYPILIKGAFLRSLRENAYSHLLLNSVLIVASTHCDSGLLQKSGFQNRFEACETYYKRARALYDGDVEDDKITLIQSMFLLQFWWRGITDHKDTLWWLAGATRVAQSMGLHRSTSNSKMSMSDKILWRRIWWLLYLRDRQAASHLGKPLLIRDEDCDVENLTASDLDDLEHVQAIYIQQQIKISKLVAGIISCEFSPGDGKPLEERTKLREQCHADLRQWQVSLPPEIVYKPNSWNLYAMYLHLGFLAQLLLLNRPVIFKDTKLPASIREPTEKIAIHSADAITKVANEIITHWGYRYLSQHGMSCLFSALTVQLVNRRSTDAAKAADAERKMHLNLRHLGPLGEILPLAKWLKKRFLRILEKNVDVDRVGPVPTSNASQTASTVPKTSHQQPAGDTTQAIRSNPPMQQGAAASVMTTIPEETAANVAMAAAAEAAWTQNSAAIWGLDPGMRPTGEVKSEGVPRLLVNGSDSGGGLYPIPMPGIEDTGQAVNGMGGMGSMQHTAMLPDYDYRWYVDYDISNPFWWASQQGTQGG